MLPIISESEEKPVVLLFTAEWLGSAHILETFFQELAPDYPNLVIYKIDVDTNQELPIQFGVSQVPTTVFLRNGEIREYELGVLSKKKLRLKFQSLIDDV